MRISTKMVYDRLMIDVQNGADMLYNAQEKMSTGRKINRPSDDVTNLSRYVNYKAKLSEIEKYKRTIETASFSLKVASNALENVSDLISIAKGITVKAITMDGNDRQAFASQVDGIIASVIATANTKVGDKYIFSGSKTDTQPIDVTTGRYQGNLALISLEIAKGVTVFTNMPGSEIFSYASGVVYDDYRVGVEEPVTLTPANNTLRVSTDGGTTFTNITLGTGQMTVNAILGAIASATAMTYSYNPTTGNYTFTNNSGSDVVLDFSHTASTIKDAIGLASTYTVPNTQSKNGTVPLKDMMEVDDPNNADFYNFNNNYLNNNYLLRALNYLKQSMLQGKTIDSDRKLSKALEYLDNLAKKVADASTELAMRATRLETEKKNHTNNDLNFTNYASDIITLQPDDYAKLAIEIQMKEQTLQSLRKVTSDFMKSNLFDYL